MFIFPALWKTIVCASSIHDLIMPVRSLADGKKRDDTPQTARRSAGGTTPAAYWAKNSARCKKLKIGTG
jgi:hypothetical protein